MTVPIQVVRLALRKLGVDEWLIRTVMVLYTLACTVVRTYTGLSESFEVKVGLHQGSVLCPLLFVVVMYLAPVKTEVVHLPSCCMLMTWYLWHQQWSSLVDVLLKGELDVLTKDGR